MERNSNSQTPKVVATALIWGFTTGMLAICIPLAAVTESGAILPLAVILGASGSTVTIWQSAREDRRKKRQVANQLEALNQRIELLENARSSETVEQPQDFEAEKSVICCNVLPPL